MGAPRVVFDGTRQAPWVNGPYLVVPYDPPRAAPEAAPRLDTAAVQAAVLEELRAGPQTYRGLIEAIGQGDGVVNTVLANLQRWGVVQKVGTTELPDSRLGGGRRVYLYGLAPDGDG